ncbi:hypothetical protein OHS18_20695 [Amycolatopsis sp. NBC_00355]|uniref:hypothetical protein n=1 Tax=Amycolatopsis sp. NBC_00355 TaxID=2975957 RepID=UPI002E264CC9
MLIRAIWAAATAFAGVFATLAAVGAPVGAMLGWSLPAAAVGAVAAVVLPRRRKRGPDTPADRSTNDVVAAITRPPQAPRPVAELSTDDLCTAWRRSYFQLLVARDPATRRSMVQRRQDYLDELERRDRRGFVRWLHSGARAGGDPGPFLRTRR